MQVILKQDVKGQGKKGDVIDVNEGYARNFLIKKGFAEAATATKLNEIKQKKASENYHREEELKAMHAMARELNGKSFSVKIKAGQGGKAFGSVTVGNIAEALCAAGYTVDKKRIALAQPLKNVGSYDVELKLCEGVACKIKVDVVGE